MLALLTLLAGTALADAPPPPDAAPAPESSGDRRLGPFTRDTYPSEAMYRPLALPAGMWRAGAELDADYIRISGLYWSGRGGLTASYGLNDKLELDAFAGWSPSGPRAGLGITALIIDRAALDLAFAAGLSVASVAPGWAPGLQVSVPVRWLLSGDLFLTFGNDLIQLQLAPFLAQMALKVGLGAQITSGVAIALQTDLLALAAPGIQFGRLVLPLDLSATVAVARGFDVRARVLVLNAADPRLAGTLSVAGSAYF